MKHAPAPWHYLTTDCGMPIIDANGQRVCDMDCVDFYDICDNEVAYEAHEEERDNNARLIAAAPMMLETLIDAREALRGTDKHAFLFVVDAAIKQAKGE